MRFIILLLIISIKLEVFGQINQASQDFIIESDEKNRTYFSTIDKNIHVFYYTENKLNANKVNSILLNIYPKIKMIFNPNYDYNIIYYFNTSEFLSSNILNNNQLQVFNFYDDVIIEPQLEIIRINISNINEFQLMESLIRGVLLLQIKKQIRLNHNNHIIDYNASFVNALCQSYYPSEVWSNEKYCIRIIDSLIKNDLHHNIPITDLVKDDIFLIQFLKRLKYEKGFGIFLKLYTYDYSSLKYDEVYKILYSQDFNQEFTTWVEKKMDIVLMDMEKFSSKTKFKEPNLKFSKINYLVKKDFLRFNGIITEFKSITSQNDETLFLIPYKNWYKLFKHSDDEWIELSEIKYIGHNIKSFYSLPTKMLFEIPLDSFKYSIFDIRSRKNFRIELPTIITENTQNIQDFYIKEIGNEKYELSFVIHQSNQYFLYKFLIERNQNTYNSKLLECVPFLSSHIYSSNKFYSYHTDKVILSHTALYHIDTISIGPGFETFVCDKCKMEEQTSFYIRMRYEDSIQKILSEMKQKSIENDSLNIIPKFKYQNLALSEYLNEVELYDIKLMHNNLNAGIYADNLLDYHPLFENNGEFNYVMPGAIGVQRITDLYNNYNIVIGLKLPINMEGSDFISRFRNYKHRGNWYIGFDRHVRYINISNKNTWTDSLLNVIPNQRKLIITKIVLGYNYPLRNFWNLNLESQIQRFKTVFSSIDSYSLFYSDTVNYWNHNRISFTKTNRFLKSSFLYDLNIGMNAFTYNWQHQSPEIFIDAYLDLRGIYKINNFNVLRTNLLGNLNLYENKLIYNIAGVEGNVFPAVDSLELNLQNSNFLLMQYVSPFRGSYTNHILTNRFLLQNIEYMVNIGGYLSKYSYVIPNKRVNNIIGNVQMGIYLDNLLFVPLNNSEINYKFSFGPLIRLFVGNELIIDYSYSIPIKNYGIWYISVKNSLIF